jgi:hypothetical protein
MKVPQQDRVIGELNVPQQDDEEGRQLTVPVQPVCGVLRWGRRGRLAVYMSYRD